MGHQPRVLSFCLREQQVVERIAVPGNLWQAIEFFEMPGFEPDRLEALRNGQLKSADPQMSIFPTRCFTDASQHETTLKRTSPSLLAMSVRDRGRSSGLSRSHHSRTCVSSSNLTS